MSVNGTKIGKHYKMDLPPKVKLYVRLTNIGDQYTLLGTDIESKQPALKNGNAKTY